MDEVRIYDAHSSTSTITLLSLLEIEHHYPLQHDVGPISINEISLYESCHLLYFQSAKRLNLYPSREVVNRSTIYLCSFDAVGLISPMIYISHIVKGQRDDKLFSTIGERDD